MSTPPSSQFLEALKPRSSSSNNQNGLAPAWLRDLRTAAGSFLETAALPGAKDEEWKYSSLSPLAQYRFSPGPAEAVTISSSLRRWIAQEDINIVVGSGLTGRNTADLPKGMKILTGEEAFREAEKIGAFSLKTKNDSELFLRLNDAHCHDIVLVDVVPGAEIEPLLHFIHRVDDKATGRAYFPRGVLRLGKGARLRLVETYAAHCEQPLFMSGVTDIRMAEEASLEMAQVFLNGPEAFHVASTRVVQARASRLRSFQFTNGARMFRNNLSVLLEGEGGEAYLNGLHQLDGARHADSHTFVEHIAPNAQSNQLYKTVLEGESRSVFNGKILVHREAQLTNSYQLNKNLLLSREARVDTKPQLEISADDVKCSHGATLGQLDDDQLFYFATRGIPKGEAKAMLVQGFVDDVIAKIQDPQVQSKVVLIMNERAKRDGA